MHLALDVAKRENQMVFKKLLLVGLLATGLVGFGSGAALADTASTQHKLGTSDLEKEYLCIYTNVVDGRTLEGRSSPVMMRAENARMALSIMTALQEMQYLGDSVESIQCRWIEDLEADMASIDYNLGTSDLAREYLCTYTNTVDGETFEGQSSPVKMRAANSRMALSTMTALQEMQYLGDSVESIQCKWTENPKIEDRLGVRF